MAAAMYSGLISHSDTSDDEDEADLVGENHLISRRRNHRRKNNGT